MSDNTRKYWGLQATREFVSRMLGMQQEIKANRDLSADNRKRLDGIDGRLAAHDGRLDEAEGRIDTHDTAIKQTLPGDIDANARAVETLRDEAVALATDLYGKTAEASSYASDALDVAHLANALAGSADDRARRAQNDVNELAHNAEVVINEFEQKKADRSELSNVLAVTSEQRVEDIEPSIVADALRKTPQLLSPAEQEQVKRNLAISKTGLFDDMWRQAVGKWGGVDRETHPDAPYTIADLHLTYEEALETMDFGHLIYGSQHQYGNTASLRVNLPPVFGHNSNFIGTQMFTGSSVEVAILAHGVGGFLSAAIHPLSFRDCKNLRRIATTLREPSSAAAGQPVTFPGCPNLVDVRINLLKCDISFPDSPKLSHATLDHLVANAANTAAITVTVHPDVYAKLTDAANEQWHKILTDATARDITFATA